MLNSTTTCDNSGGSSTICSTVYQTSTSTDPTIYNGFTAGEIADITVGLLQFIVILVVAYHLFFRKVKIKN